MFYAFAIIQGTTSFFFPPSASLYTLHHHFILIVYSLLSSWTDSGLTDEQIVGELFKNFVDNDGDPAFLSSPESDFEFVPPPPSSLPMSSTSSPSHEESYGVVPLSSGPSPPPAADLYPRLNKKARGTPDIERWTPYNPPVRQYYALYDSHSEEL